MARKRVIAYFMHESEMVSAQNALSNSQTTESFVAGEIDESQIQGLEDQGLIVTVLRDRGVAGPHTFDFDLAGAPGTDDGPEIAAAPQDPAAATYYSVRLIGPLLPEWRSRLENEGAQIIEGLGGDRYTIHCDAAQAAAVSALDFVDEGPGFFADRDAGVRIAAGTPVSETAVQSFEVLLHRATDADVVMTWLRGQAEVLVQGAQRRKIRFTARATSPIPDQLRALPEVFNVEPVVEPKLHNDRSRVLIGIDSPASPPVSIPWTGQGEIIGIADTGLDENHPDFQGRIVAAVALGRPGDPSDPHGHGTHVAGSVLGDGTASGGNIRGTAPEADLYFQSVMDARGRLAGLPWDLFDLFDPAYQRGARVHNNSWGAATSSEYTANSIEVDEFVVDHPDFLVVISAGNEGTAANPRNSNPGFVDWLSIGSPASSKNALTVGASRSDRETEGYSALRWKDAWPGDFPDPPIASETISGNANAIAAFSSRGPCTDHRIKPDVVAPGTDIASARAATAPLRSYWGAYPANNKYAFMGGTSMASPLVAGCAALVRQFYVVGRQHDPSAALVKATLINGATWLTGIDAIADFADEPNFHQGFGRVDVGRSLAVEDTLQLEFIDGWKNADLQFTATGQRLRCRCTVTGGQELRLCLVWTDPAARALQNNLNLLVESPTGKKHIGNEHLPQRITPFDTENNVEVVRIDNPPPGEYLIQVNAANLVSTGNQAFALVVIGELHGGLT